MTVVLIIYKNILLYFFCDGHDGHFQKVGVVRISVGKATGQRCRPFVLKNCVFERGIKPFIVKTFMEVRFLARDGTARGSNIKVNAGRKSKALSEKIATGNPGGRTLKVIDLPDATELEGVDIPEPSSYIKAKQKAVGEYDAEHIYKYIYTWLKEKGCDKLISKHLVEQYAMSVSRLIQCEEAISEFGFLSKHPTTGAACASPFVAMAQNYQKQVNTIWYQIFQVVRENCSTDFNPDEADPMEMLLRSRG